jgi:hypothetical protein
VVGTSRHGRSVEHLVIFIRILFFFKNLFDLIILEYVAPEVILNRGHDISAGKWCLNNFDDKGN